MMQEFKKIGGKDVTSLCVDYNDPNDKTSGIIVMDSTPADEDGNCDFNELFWSTPSQDKETFVEVVKHFAEHMGVDLDDMSEDGSIL